ncbi:hypothetical protein CDAR_480331 [Caerostris darwini]|uniref:Uncharacterized protein n=1 Tax=Caerostris darwini TaxID=1538125 RepID=A0AAV4V0B0_9ARAC|nr:hypothetical protein CDAR_480331 [Caerostris darwini]
MFIAHSRILLDLFLRTPHSQYSRHPIKHNWRLQSHLCRPIAIRSALEHPHFFYLFPRPHILQTPHHHIHLCDSNNHFPNSQLLPKCRGVYESGENGARNAFLMPLLASQMPLLIVPDYYLCPFGL